MLLDPVSEELVKWFEAQIGKLIGGRQMKIWLAKSSGHRIDTLISIGTAQPEPIRLFDHMAGFYLLGEGVTPDLLSPMHAVFTEFCERHMHMKKQKGLHRTVVKYRSSHDEAHYWYNRLIMHYPFSASADDRDSELI